MKSVYNFVVKPKGKRYNNTKKVGDSELIVNTEIFNHQYTNREAVVISMPIVGDTSIKPGDTVMVTNQSAKQHNQIKLEEVLAAGSLENYLKQLNIAPEVIDKWVELAGVIKKTNENASIGFITTGEAVLKGTDLLSRFGQTLSDLEPQSKKQ